MFKNKINILGIVERKPLTSFLIVLGILLTLIVSGNYIRKAPTQVQTYAEPKPVALYTIGSVPKVTFQAKVEKSGIIHITAANAGIVSQINVLEGMKIVKGTKLLSLANNYTGDNIYTISRQLAEKQNTFVQQTYTQQQSIINLQRKLADESNDNFKQMRDITSSSIDSTQKIIDLNNQIITSLSTNIKNLEVDPVGNASLILSSQQMLSQFESANAQLSSGLKSAKYQINTENSPSKVSGTQKKLALAQLDLQAASLDLNRAISSLQLQIAKINESLTNPVAPFAGTVEHIKVRIGQTVTPGTELVVLSSSNSNNIKATIFLPKEIATNLSKTETTIFDIDGKKVEATPYYVSNEATDGNLYSAVYVLPNDIYTDITDGSYISAQVPVGYPNSNAAFPYVPLDTVYQTQDDSYLFIVENGKAKAQHIELGGVYGSYVSVKSGLKMGDILINDRTVVDGDSVKALN